MVQLVLVHCAGCVKAFTLLLLLLLLLLPSTAWVQVNYGDAAKRGVVSKHGLSAMARHPRPWSRQH